MFENIMGHTPNPKAPSQASTILPARPVDKDSPLRMLIAHRSWLIPISIVVFLVFWEILVRIGNFPSFILPSPQQVAVRFWRALLQGSLLRHTGITLFEVLMGLLAGSTLATVLGYLLAKFPTMEKLLSPYLVASPGHPAGCHCSAVSNLVWSWYFLQNPDLRVDRLLPRTGEYHRRVKRSTSKPA